MNLLQQHNAQPQKQPKYVPIFIDRAFTGLYTQRNVLHDPSDIYTARFYGGRPDALWMGRNVELTNRLTLQRRPGHVTFSTTTYPTAPLRAFPFQLTDGTIRVIIDTGSTGSLSISSVANSSGGSAVYTGTFPNGGSNAYAGMVFQIAGFVTNPGNNGTFICSASSTTTLTLNNANAISESHAATAISTGAVYWDQQNGSKTLLFGKSVGAGQTYFQAVGGVLYMGDGVDTLKWTPLNTNLNAGNLTNPNVSIWNWGGVAPTVAPGVVATSSGAAAGTWQASTMFSTMGLAIDANNNIQQIHAIAGGTNVGTVAILGKTSAGGPGWNQTPGGTTTDNTVTWRNLGKIVQWQPFLAIETETQLFSTNTTPAAVYSKVSGCIYVNIASSGPGFSVIDPGTITNVPGAVINPNPFALQTAAWYCLGNINQANKIFQNWAPSQTTNPPPNQRRVVEPFTVPQPGQPLTATIYLQESTNSGTTNTTFGTISWATNLGFTTTEPANANGSIITWRLVSLTKTWQAGTQYNAWTSPSSASFGVVVDNNGSFWVCIGSGLSGGSDPFAVWYWQSNHAYTQGTIIIDTNSNRQQAQNSGTSTNGSHPAWATAQGATTSDTGVTWKNLGSAYGIQQSDNQVNWTNVGQSTSWAATTQWYLPTAGFDAPFGQTAYGSPDIQDTNNPADIEFVVQSGLSGTNQPTWNTSSAIGSSQTVDNVAVWVNNGPFKQNQLVWSSSHTWAYSYKARSLTDFYSVTTGGVPTNTPPPGQPFNGPLPAPTGSETNLITTASPVTTLSGANAGAVVSIYGNYSSDPQFDTIVIWRDADGGGFANMFELTEIPNIPSLAGTAKYTINGVNYDWVFQDFLPDVATSQFPGLNNQISAPINHVNDPPLSTFLPMAYNFQKIWGTSGQNVLFSKGLDTPIVGNGAEAFPPTYTLPFLATVTRLVRTPVGMVTFTVDSVEIIGGGPSTSSFYSVTLSPGIGLLSYNFLDVYGGEIFFFSADNEFMVMSPSLNIANFGFPVGDQLANLPSSGVPDTTWNPSAGYVAVHQNGNDNCIFLADGSTGWYRINPRQVPGGPQGPEPIWSPFAVITGGAQMVQSVEYAPGLKALLVGPSAGGGSILKRSLSVFTDNGTSYDAFFVMGGIMLAHPGQRALLKFIECDFSGISYRPTVSFLLNEISGSFTAFAASPVTDPPSVYGANAAATYSPNRYYFSGNNGIAVARHLQIKVDFGTTANGDELYDITIYGRLVVEQ